MIGAIIQDCLQVHDRITCQDAVQASLTQTLFHSGEVVAGHAAAENFLCEYHFFFFTRFKTHPNVAILAAAAGLLLELTLLFHRLADLFTIRHASGIQDCFHAEAALELGDQDVQLDVAGDDHLMGLCVVGDGEGGIFFVQTVQADTDLIFLAAGLGSDGLGEDGFCEGDGIQSHALGADGVVGLELVHLCDGADVAGSDALDFLDGLLAAHDVHTAHLFAVAGTAVGQRCVAGQGAVDDLDIGILAILVRDSLEHECHGVAVAYGQLDGFAVRVSTCHGQTFGGIGNQVDDSLQEGLGAQAGESAAAEHGDQGAFLDACAQAGSHFVSGKFFALEELFHQLFAGLCHVLHQSHVGFFHSIGSVSGDVLCHGLVLVHGVGLLAHHVDDAGDLFPVELGDDQRSDSVAELLLELCHDSVEVAVVFVSLGDVDQAGQAAGLDLLVSAFCTHGDVALCGQDDDGSVSHLQSGR